MSEYYFVSTYLSPLNFDVNPEMSLPEFNQLLQDNLTARDYQKILAVRHFYDVLNLRALWLKTAFDLNGLLNARELENAIQEENRFPSFVYEFLEAYEKTDERLKNFPLLVAQLFQQAQLQNEGLFNQYLILEREMRLVLTVFRAKKLGRSISQELQYEDPEESLIAQLLANQDNQNVEPPEKYKELQELFENLGGDPLALEKALDQYRFNYLGNLAASEDPFSIQYILAYFLQMILIKKWFEMDHLKGMNIANTLVKEK